MADYYEVLGVPKSATAGDIRAAYVRLAKERHPDRFRDPVEKQMLLCCQAHLLLWRIRPVC